MDAAVQIEIGIPAGASDKADGAVADGGRHDRAAVRYDAGRAAMYEEPAVTGDGRRAVRPVGSLPDVFAGHGAGAGGADVVYDGLCRAGSCSLYDLI